MCKNKEYKKAKRERDREKEAACQCFSIKEVNVKRCSDTIPGR